MDNEVLNKRVYVRDIKRAFKLEQVCGDNKSLDRWVIAPDINRPGLELAGYIRPNDLKRITIIGNKEMDFIKTLPENILTTRFESITDAYTPCIIMTGGNHAPETLLRIAKARNFPIFEIEEYTHRFVVQVIAYLDERLAPSKTMHAVMMDIYGVGVMICGESGIGKSELALELIRRGHMLVADDCVEVYRIHNDIICTPPPVLRNMLEIRGVGVIDVSMAFGSTSTLDKTNLDVIINLVPFDAEQIIDRIGIEKQKRVDILGVEKPVYDIPIKEGRAMGVIVESAVANYRLSQKGLDSAKLFDQRVMEFMKKNQENEL